MRALLLALMLLTLFPAPAEAQPSGAAVDRAIERGTRFLRRQQLRDGSWTNPYRKPGGITALVTLALLQSGESPRSRTIRAALEHLQRTPNTHTYTVGLKAMTFAAADPDGYRDEIRACAKWLVGAQQNIGLWGYKIDSEGWDHSNTQYALLGLHAAAEVGVPVPRGVWERARTGVTRTQARDGGWRYRNEGESYGSMTAANISNLAILGSTVATPIESGYVDGKADRCGVYRSNRPLRMGLNWLGRHFDAEENPNRRAFRFYWLYSVERAGILTGQRYFGRHDWYQAGSATLLSIQNADGSWGGNTSTGGRLSHTAFSVLFLAKGKKPLLIQKLQWSDDDRWSPDRHDCKHLVEYIGDKLGQETEWQIVRFDQELEDWLAAPLLYVQGHEFPDWGDNEREKIVRYLEQGGTLFFEACCGEEAFKLGMETFARETFPGQPLRKLDSGHPVYSSFYQVPPRDLHGIEVGCRTSVLYSPRDLSCLWEQRDVELLSEPAFKLGTNIAAFATGRQALRDRLDTVVVPETDPKAAVATPPGDGTLRIGQVFYRGDWRPDPFALRNFATFLQGQLSLEVSGDAQPVKLGGGDLYRYPLLYLTGHYEMKLEPGEQMALRDHLDRGGFLFVDACCGRGEFDRSFRKLVEQAFGQPLEKLPRSHPIFKGQPGFPIETVRYKEAVRKTQPALEDPELWGLERDGRLVLVYSPYALGCGLDGHTCHNCRGLINEDARRLTANVVLFALTQ